MQNAQNPCQLIRKGLLVRRKQDGLQTFCSALLVALVSDLFLDRVDNTQSLRNHFPCPKRLGDIPNPTIDRKICRFIGFGLIQAAASWSAVPRETTVVTFSATLVQKSNNDKRNTSEVKGSDRAGKRVSERASGTKWIFVWRRKRRHEPHDRVKIRVHCRREQTVSETRTDTAIHKPSDSNTHNEPPSLGPLSRLADGAKPLCGLTLD